MVGGLSYSWGVYVEPMQTQFGWTKNDATLPLSVFMLCFALMMIPAGKLQEKIGLKRQIQISAWLFWAAYILSALVHFTTNKWWLVSSYGILGGISCGMSYSCIAPPIRQWFPDKPGLAVSLGVMGFGLASAIFAPFKARVAIIHFGIAGTFIFTGFITFVISWISSILMRFPDSENLKQLFAKTPLTNLSKDIPDCSPKMMLRQPLFWLTWLAFLGAVFGSLLIIGILASFGMEVLNLSIAKAALPLSVFALTNGLSRPLAGWISDRIGVLRLMIIVFICQTAVFLLMPHCIHTLIQLNIAAVILGIGIGVCLALFPILSSDFFGVKHLGVNYGLLFSAYGFGALAIPVGTRMHSHFSSYTQSLYLAGTLSGLATCILAGILIYKNKTTASCGENR